MDSFSFSKNDDVILFLSSTPNLKNVDDPNDNSYGIIGFSQGIYNKDDTTSARVSTMANDFFMKIPSIL